MRTRIAASALLFLAACGQAPRAITGQWSLVSHTDGANTINNVDTVLAGHTWRVNGTFTADESDTLALAIAYVQDAHINTDRFFSVNAFVSPFTRESNVLSTVDDQVWNVAWADERLSLRVGTELTLTFEPWTPTPSETLAVTGQVSVPYTGLFEPLVAPRVALVFLLPGAQPGEMRFIVDPRDDLPLAGFGADETQTASYDLSRAEGALGIQRVTYDTAFISIGMVVVYDDRDQNSTLDELFQSCQTANQDCVRGISPVLITYRMGDSTALAASPFSFLLPAWSHAAVATELLPGGGERVGVAPLSTATVPLPIDVWVTFSGPATLPALVLEPAR
mgnify:CR=1 FL=1